MQSALPCSGAPAVSRQHAQMSVNRLSTRLAASRMPDSGFFAEVDTKAEVLPVKRGVGNGDVTKRGGRWESDFIWNKDWAKQLDHQERQRKRMEEEAKAAKEGRGPGQAADGKGFLSLTGKVDLNSMDVDLSEQLRVRKKSGSQAGTSQQQQPRQQRRRPPVQYGRDPPTRIEQRTWQRSGKYSRKVMAVEPTNEVEQDALAAKRAAEDARYQQLKQELQAWAAGLTAACLAATFAFYGRDVAASYGVGALGGLIYLRLLNKTVDGFGGMGGAGGQSRLLIPVILALGYNRYNTLVADETGLTLSLLPMLLGFFTYKGAVLAKQSLTLFGELAAASRAQRGIGSGAEGGSQGEGKDGAEMDVLSVDRAFRKRMLNEM